MSEDKRDWRRVFFKIINGSWLTSLLAVVIALLLGAILIAAAKPEVQTAATYLFARPSDFFVAVWNAVSSAYSALFQGAVFNFQTSKTTGEIFAPLLTSIKMSTPLIFAGLGLSIGFRAGLFNIGAQGQIMLGGMVCAYLGFTFQMPYVIHLAVCLLGAFIGGAAWGFIPGVLKAKTGANEVIVTIMLNSVAIYFLGWLLTLDAFQKPGQNNPISPAVAATARFPHFFDTAVDLGFVLALLAAFGVWWLMERSTLGFRIRTVGQNPTAARTAGMNVETSYIWVLVIAGGLAGLAATSQLLSTPDQQLTASVAGTFGFDAITVALLGRSKPLGTVLAGLLFGGLQAGGYLMQARTSTPIDVILVLQSVIVLMIAAPPLIRAIFRLPDPDRRRKKQAKAKLKVSLQEVSA
ncbi:MAG: ABC transporter permease [Propionibacteriaceae bacterium]|nr:ABC transporter permease [Propionibacteriaceae bacterium]